MMREMHGFLATVPFDIYELHLFHLVVKHESFTRAAEIAGLTQSAITRQMQAIERSLGITLLERTTRKVRVTPAGQYLFAESIKLLGDVDSALQGLQQQFANVRKVVRLGVSRSISLAYLPGFVHANLRRHHAVGCSISYQDSADILSNVLANELDLGVLCPPPTLPRNLIVTHRFADAFTLIVSSQAQVRPVPNRPKDFGRWVEDQQWLLINDETTTGQRLRRWMRKHGWDVSPVMELDSFDLIFNLVSLGMGVSFVPIRALALYPTRRKVVRVPLPDRFERELVVVARRQRKIPEHLRNFIENILF